MGDPAPPRPGGWEDARDRARAEVRSIFGSDERVCAACGARVTTRGRFCPECGSPFVARRVKRLGTRRAQLLFAAAAVLVLAVIGGAVALLAPGISRSRRSSAEAAARANNAAISSLVAQARAAQVLHLGRGARTDPGRAAPASARLRARSALVSRLEALIAADARARVRAGTLTGPVQYATCSPYPPGSAAAARALSVRVGEYACVAVDRVVRDRRGAGIAVFGDPFWARVDFARGRMAWCKITPRPGEGGAGTGPPPVPLAPACDLEQPYRGVVP